MYSEINPDWGDASPNNLTVCNNRLYFNANDTEDNKLMSIGSATDVVSVHTSDEFEYSGTSGFISVFVINDRLHFHAYLESERGWELYKLVDTEPNNNEIATENNVNIYPNPTIDYIIIENTDSNFTAQIFSIDGALIKFVENENIIDATDLSSGIYILKLSHAANDTLTKIIKE